MTADERERAVVVELFALTAKRGRALRSGARRFADDPAADKLVREQPFARLLGMLAQQRRTRPGRAWEVPWRLMKELGHLDPRRIAAEEQTVRDVFASGSVRGAPKTRMAEIAVRAARQVIDVYEGDASLVWVTTHDPYEIRSRVRAFYGAGPKIAAMVPALLRYGFGASIGPGGDIAVDVNVARVFCRTGLSASTDGDAVRAAARRIHPDPAALDLGAWIVGSEYCRPTDPRCTECPLAVRCTYALEQHRS